MQDMIQNYVYGNSEETFEALTLFKGVFGNLIDTNIVSIQCNLVECFIYRNENALPDQGRLDYFLLSHIQNVNEFLGEDDPKILEAYQDIYVGKLDAFNYLNYSAFDSYEPYEVRELLYSIIPYLPPIFFLKTQLFGNNPLIYKMFKNHFLAEVAKLSDASNGMDDTEALIKELLDEVSEVAKQSAKTIQKKIVRRVKQIFKSKDFYVLSLQNPLNGKPENHWDGLGEALNEDNLLKENFFKNYEKQIENLCIEEFEHLNGCEKSTLILDELEVEEFSLEAYQQARNLLSFVIIEDLIEPIISEILNQAKKDWISKKSFEDIQILEEF